MLNCAHADHNGSQGVIQDLLIIQVEPSLFCLKVTCLEKSYLNFQSGLCSYLYSITVFSPCGLYHYSNPVIIGAITYLLCGSTVL